jgi:glycosyltransferase involved in cell wall biosynthesis
MRIAIDGRTIVRGKSGVGNYAERTLRALLDIDHKNEYHLFLVEHLESFDAPNLVKVVLPRIHKAGHNRYWENIDLPLYAARHGIDLFFGPAYALPILPQLGRRFRQIPLPRTLEHLLNSKQSLKFVVSIPDVIGIVHPETFTPKMRMWQRLFVTNAARIAHSIITISESSKRDIARLFPITPERIHVTPLSVDESFSPQRDSDDAARVRLKYSLPQQFVLYVGTIEPRKNVTGLARAYALLREDLRKEFSLVIAGSPGWYSDQILAEVDGLGLQKQIIMPGYIEDKDLPVLLSMSTLFVFPSFYEGFGYPPLEAMACGVPVITSNSSSLPEVVGDAGIMIDPADHKSMSEAMARVLEDEGLRSQMIQKGLRQVLHFSWVRTAQETLKVLESVVHTV